MNEPIGGIGVGQNCDPLPPVRKAREGAAKSDVRAIVSECLSRPAALDKDAQAHRFLLRSEHHFGHSPGNHAIGFSAARFLKLGRVYLEFAARHWRLWSSVFEHRPRDSEALAAYMGRLDAILTNIEQPLHALLPDLDPGARRGLARTLFAAVHGVVSLGLDGKLGPIGLEDLHEQIRSLLDATLRGLRAGETASL